MKRRIPPAKVVQSKTALYARQNLEFSRIVLADPEKYGGGIMLELARRIAAAAPVERGGKREDTA